MDVGLKERKNAASAAACIVEMEGQGRFVGDDETLLLAYVCLAHDLMIESAETRMTEASLALAGLHTRMREAERTRDRVALEVLPAGWFWDLDDESRARKVDSVDFCEPPIGGSLRAIGMTPPRVQMAVSVRGTRLAIKNGKVGTAPAPAIEFCVAIKGNKGADGPFLTLEEAVDVGHSSGLPYRAGGVTRPVASRYVELCRESDLLQETASEQGWVSWAGAVFEAREGAEQVLEMAFDAAFQSEQWRIADDAAHYAAGSRKPSPMRVV